MQQDPPRKRGRNSPKPGGKRPLPSHSHRGEIFSRRLNSDGGTSYFLNLKENREADIYLNIVESRPRTNYKADEHEGNPKQAQKTGRSFERHSILVFAEQRDAFLAACLAALEALAEGRDYSAEVQSKQRQFALQVRFYKRRVLTISEERLHYARPLQEKIRIPQGSAVAFSRLLIQTAEKWLQCPAKREKS